MQDLLLLGVTPPSTGPETTGGAMTKLRRAEGFCSFDEQGQERPGCSAHLLEEQIAEFKEAFHQLASCEQDGHVLLNSLPALDGLSGQARRLFFSCVQEATASSASGRAAGQETRALPD